MIIPVILSGGAGTRLWPVSRESHPKPFMKLADGESLLLKTYRRALAVMESLGGGKGELLTVTNRDYYFLSKDELAVLKPGVPLPGAFLLEPEGRNTAPAVALAAHQVVEHHGPDALMLILAADHLIQDPARFTAAVADAVALAQQGHLVTFGIVPTEPETGFGYIEAGEALPQGRKAVRFVEKPSLEKAQAYLASGNFYWNSGMFCFTAGRLLEEMALHAPDVATAVNACWQALKAQPNTTGHMIEIPAQAFAQVPDISIDYAVMEKSSHVAVVPGNFGWSDIGSGNAISHLVEADAHNNRILGEAILIDSQNTFVQSEDRLVAGVGPDNLMIIDTPDALLVAHPDKAQDVKKIVVSGMARVVNGERQIMVGTNESTYIPAGHKHRLENPGVLDLVMIEVQSGEYLGEDDIVRFEDHYGRV